MTNNTTTTAPFPAPNLRKDPADRFVRVNFTLHPRHHAWVISHGGSKLLRLVIDALMADEGGPDIERSDSTPRGGKAAATRR